MPGNVYLPGILIYKIEAVSIKKQLLYLFRLYYSAG